MSIEQPVPGEPRRPDGPRDPGDAWVVADSGERYWGRFGAAGLLAVDPQRGVLLQHRVAWSHFGGTWGLPGGALQLGESAVQGALREAAEEAGVPEDALRVRCTSVLDLDIWSYTTVIATARPFEAVISDPESVALEWVPVGEVGDRPLHPGFAAAWETLRESLPVRPVVVVDVANVMGSKPDGWWRDRAGAAGRVVDELRHRAAAGIPSERLELPLTRWYPEFVAVLEGEARAGVPASPERAEPRALADAAAVRVVHADGHGDDEIVAQAARAVDGGAAVTVITSDRGLAERVRALGARVAGVTAL